MAKISARGAYKLAEISFDESDRYDDPSDSWGGVLRRFFVLRSDGHILLASSYPQHPLGAYYRKRSSYKGWMRFKPEAWASWDTATKRDKFHDLIARKFPTRTLTDREVR